jgi:hypothetical protein
VVFKRTIVTYYTIVRLEVLILSEVVSVKKKANFGGHSFLSALGSKSDNSGKYDNVNLPNFSGSQIRVEVVFHEVALKIFLSIGSNDAFPTA